MGKIRLLGQHILQFLTCCTDITFSHTVYQQNLIRGDFHTCHLRTKYRHQKGNLHAFFLLQLHRTVHSKELKDVLPKKADFAHLEKLLYAASKPNGKKVLTGKELGIPSLEKGKIELSNFSDKPFALTPTQLSQKYKEVELEELLEMLMDL